MLYDNIRKEPRYERIGNIIKEIRENRELEHQSLQNQVGKKLKTVYEGASAEASRKD